VLSHSSNHCKISRGKQTLAGGMVAGVAHELLTSSHTCFECGQCHNLWRTVSSLPQATQQTFFNLAALELWANCQPVLL
jgi:hypothetical protein